MDSKVAMCNAYKPDLVVDVHFNAGGGQGFEIYHSHFDLGYSKSLYKFDIKKLCMIFWIKLYLAFNKLL